VLVGFDLSTFSSSEETGWNYRIFGTRPVLIKAKNDRMRKVVALDLLTDLPFAFEVPESIMVESIEVEKEYSATLKVFTLKNIMGVEKEFVEFFEVLDVDQSFEDFIKAYWMYPNHIAFELTEIEQP
jgi:hypothetical protein